MIKKFAILATVAVLFVACNSNETPETMESQTEANEQEMLDAAAAEEEAVVVPATTGAEEVEINETDTTVVEGVVVEEEKN